MPCDAIDRQRSRDMMRRDRIAGPHHQMDHLEGGGSGQCGCRGRGIVYHAETRYLARLAMMQRHASALPWLELANESTKPSAHFSPETFAARMARAAHVERPRSDHFAAFRAEHRLSSMSRSEEHTSALQSLMRTSYAAFCL